ncbi:MAG TPA: YceI family protein [Gemmatimonadaceae bacterium]
MRTATRPSALLFALLIPAAGWRAPSERLTLETESRLWVEGSSTIRSFTCKADVVNAAIDTRTANAIPLLLTGDKAVIALDVKVPAEKLDCGNGTMNDHMLEALKAHENPTILFRLSSYEIARGTGTVTGTLKGTLSLGSVQKPLTVTAEGKPEGDMLRVTGATEVRMTDYDLKPPTLMFGRIKVNDAVTVKFDLLLKS